MVKNEKSRFAIIGAGNIAGKYADAFKHIETVELAGVVSRTEAKAANFAKQYNIKSWADNLEALFKHCEIDAVVVATPSGMHAEAGIAAAKAGKHVLCEKPLDITLEKIDAMIEACRKANVKLGCTYQHRTAEHNKIVYEAIQSGKLGKIYIANGFLKNYRPQNYYDSAAWRGTWELDGGGPFIQQGSHLVDLLVWMMGGWRKVFAMTKTAEHEIVVEDMGHAIVEYANGAQGVLEAATVVKPGYPNKMEFHGEKGSIIVSEAGIVDWEVEGTEKPALESGRASGTADPMAISSIGHEMIIRDFVEAIIQNKEPLISGEKARVSIELITSIYKSAREKKIVQI